MTASRRPTFQPHANPAAAAAHWLRENESSTARLALRRLRYLPQGSRNDGLDWQLHTRCALASLNTAIQLGSPQPFARHAARFAALLCQRGVGTGAAVAWLVALGNQLRDELPPGVFAACVEAFRCAASTLLPRPHAAMPATL